MRRIQMPREWYVPTGAAKVADKLSDAVAYVYAGTRRTNGVAYFGAVIFFGKQAKPVSNYTYRTEQQRNSAIGSAFESRRKSLAFKSGLRAERAAWVPTYKVGDIFRTCWGYDQTNREYFGIIEIKGKHAILRELAQERTATGWETGNCVPLPGKYIGEPIRKLMQQHGIRIDDVRWASYVPGETVGGVRVISPSRWSSYA